jgi:hypothetical protein
MRHFLNKANNTLRIIAGCGGLLWLGGAAVSWLATPAFKAAGWAGIGKAMLVGSGTTMGWSLLAIPGGFAGMILGGIAGGLLTRRQPGLGGLKGSVIGGALGAAAVSIPAGIFGAAEGYSLSRQWLAAAVPQPVPAVRTLDAATPAPAPAVTVQRPAA